MDDYDDVVFVDMEDFKVPLERPIPESPKTVVEYDASGEFIKEHGNVKEAAMVAHVSKDYIVKICIGERMQCYTNKHIYLYRGDDIITRLKMIYKSLKDIPSRKGVDAYSLYGRFLYHYDTAKEAARCNNISASKVTYCCKGKRLYVNDRIYMYPGDKDKLKERVKAVKQELYRLSSKRPICKPVDAYTLEGEFVKGFPSASAASREYKIHISQIARCCHGKNYNGRNALTCRGMIFLWVGESISERLELIQLIKQQKEKKNE